MVDLSIIIVNYNVRHFIIQCIESIYKSDFNGYSIEIFVVDNASIDGSVSAIKNQFPKVKVIANEVNVGFGKANNQAILLSKSKYCLLLNPDTILQENTLTKCIEYMQLNDSCGAVGVKMVDGQGNYLRESKRSLPTPSASFFKITRLNDLFPNSNYLNGYYTSDRTGEKEEHVEVLCGAFMFCKTDLIQEIGGFDEAFFMYGEDIDLSKRILESGHFIHYLPQARIIHFKGESSKKASYNYIHSFYSAMIIYVEKHFTSQKAILTKVFLKLAIFASGLLRLLKEYSIKFIRPLIDFVVIFFTLELLKVFWSNIYFGVPNYYDHNHFLINKSFYSFVWVFNLWFWGWYDGARKLKSLFYAIGFGTMMILVSYALFPNAYRSSRILIVMGAIAALFIPLLNNIIINKFILFKNPENLIPSKILIVGNKESKLEIINQLNSNQVKYNLIGLINPIIEGIDPDYLNTIKNLNEVVNTFHIDEVIFSHNDISAEKIMDLMTISESKVSYKIAGNQNTQIIGSDNSTSQGKIFNTFSNFNLSKSVYKRIKRLFDLFLGLMLIVLFPFLFFNMSFKNSIVPNLIHLIFGKKTMIGYDTKLKINSNLPTLKEPIIQINKEIAPKEYSILIEPNLNAWYAKNYSPFIDLEILKNYLS